MKNKYILLLIVLVSSAFQLSAQQKLQLQGKISEIPKDSVLKVYIFSYNTDKNQVIDSVIPDKKGVFKYVSKKAYQAGVYAIGASNEYVHYIILNPEEKGITIESSFSDFINGMISINNSPENEAYLKLLNLLDKHQNALYELEKATKFSRIDSFYTRAKESHDEYLVYRYTLLNNKLLQLKEEYKGTFTADKVVNLYIFPQMVEYPETSRYFDNMVAFNHYHYWDFVDFSDERILNVPFFHQKILDYLSNFSDFESDKAGSAIDQILARAIQNPMVYEYCVKLLIQILAESERDDLLSYLIPTYVDSYKGSFTESAISFINKYKLTLPGSNLNDFEAFNNFGQTIKISSVYSQSKYTLIYFWASTQPSIAEGAKILAQIYDAYSAKGFMVAGFSFDNNAEAWKASLVKYNMQWANLSDLKGGDSPIIQNVGLKQIPFMLLVNSEGTIIAKNPNFEALVKFLNQSLSE